MVAEERADGAFETVPLWENAASCWIDAMSLNDVGSYKVNLRGSMRGKMLAPGCQILDPTKLREPLTLYGTCVI